MKESTKISKENNNKRSIPKANTISSDTSLLKVLTTSYDMNVNGIYYDLLNGQDADIYKVLNEEELQQEQIEIESFQNKIRATSAKRLNKSMSSTKTSDKTVPVRPKSASSTVPSNASNIKSSTSTKEYTPKNLQKIDEKYSNNIRIIDNLISEKMSMADKIKELESEVLKLKSSNISSENTNPNVNYKIASSDSRDIDELDESFTRIESVSNSKLSNPVHIKVNSHNVNGGIRSSREIEFSDNMMSVTEAGELFGDIDFTLPKIKRDANFKEGTNSKKVPQNVSASTRMSNTRISTGSFSLSANLEDDIKRYNERREQFNHREKELEAERKEFEKQQKERLLRAASVSKDSFKHVVNRNKKFLEDKEEKLKRLEREKIENEIEIQKSIRQQRQSQISKPVIKHELDWKEFKKLEDIKRKERAELLRIKTLESYSKLNPNVFEAKTSRPKSAPSTYTFRATADPDKIASILHKKQQAWENRLKKTKEEIHGNLERQTQITSEDPILMSMKARQDAYEQKAKERKIAKSLKEKELQKKKQEEEKRKFDKLVKMKLPENCNMPTKSAILRVEQNKKMLEKKREEEIRKQNEQEQRLKSSRETAAVVKEVMSQKEYERRMKVKNFISLQDIDRVAKEKATALKRNSMSFLNRLKQSTELRTSQPTLIERYEKDTKKKVDQSETLKRINKVLTNNASSNTVKELDIFDDKEMMLLGL